MWWKNLTTALAQSHFADTRTIDEGLCMSTILQALNNTALVEKLICRRLLGLQIVLTTTGNKDVAWT